VIFFALHNGKPTTVVSLANRGLAYGDGLFETIKVCNGRALFLTEHLRRLQRDCARLDLVLDVTALQYELALLLAQHDSGILKLIITRSAGQRGYATAQHAGAERLLLFYPQPFSDSENTRSGIAVRMCRQRLAEQPALAGMKHLNRLEQVMARAEWSDSAIAEGLMLDHAGHLIEGTMSNVFLVRAGKVQTPRLHRCGVAGVMRALVLQELAQRSAPVIEVDLVLDDLYAADEVFLTNSIIGIWPVRKIECLHKPVGDVTIAFQKALTQLIADENR
jgi:4-amino-4-deoxychorismate lyase